MITMVLIGVSATLAFWLYSGLQYLSRQINNLAAQAEAAEYAQRKEITILRGQVTQVQTQLALGLPLSRT